MKSLRSYCKRQIFKHWMILMIPLIVIAPLQIHADVFQLESDTRRYLPMQLGNWWEYEPLEMGWGPGVPGMYAPFRSEIIAEETIDNQKWFLFDHLMFMTCDSFWLSFDQNGDLLYKRDINDKASMLASFKDFADSLQNANGSPEVIGSWAEDPCRWDWFTLMTTNSGSRTEVGRTFSSLDMNKLVLLITGKCLSWNTDINCYETFIYPDYGVIYMRFLYEHLAPYRDWFGLKRCFINGQYYSNELSAKPSTWLELKSKSIAK